MSETLQIIFVGLTVILLVAFFIRVAARIRKGGGSLTTVVLGATDSFLNSDRHRASVTIVNENAGKNKEPDVHSLGTGPSGKDEYKGRISQAS